METDEQLEEFVMGMNGTVESVTTCLSQDENGEKEHGIVITIDGIDLVFLQSHLEEIAEYLGSLPIL